VDFCVSASFQNTGRVSVDGEVHGDGVLVEQIQRPDVHGPAGHVDAAGRLSDDFHVREMLSSHIRRRTGGRSGGALSPFGEQFT
jgi:hypothetical protein